MAERTKRCFAYWWRSTLWRRPGGLHQGYAGAEEEGSGFRPSRVPHRGSARNAPAEDVARSRAIQRQTKWFEISHRIEEFIKSDRKLNANVDFYSASTYHTLGIDMDLFTPIFAVSRISGWTAHVIEQLNDNRLIRPRADYQGPAYPSQYVPIEQR